MGEVGHEPGGFVGSFGQIGHALGGLARLVIQPGLQGRADRLVEQFHGEQRISVRGELGRFGQFPLGDGHLAGEQVEMTPDPEHPAPGEACLGHGRGQALGPVQVAGGQRGLGGPGQPEGSAFGRGGQLCRALPGRRGLQRSALAGGQGGGGVQGRGSRVVRTGRGGRQVPGRALRIASGHAVRQGQVCGPALCGAGQVISDGPEQRMGELDTVTDQADKARCLGLGEGLAVVAAQVDCGGHDLRERAPPGRGRDHKRVPDLRAHSLQARREALPDGCTGLQRHRGQFRAAQLLSGQRGRQLH